MDNKQIEDYILSLPGASLARPFGKDIAVYKYIAEMFAITAIGSEPLKLSLRCDPQLSAILRQKYESVMPGEKLNADQWNTLLLTGQLPWADVRDLIRHAYELVRKA